MRIEPTLYSRFTVERSLSSAVPRAQMSSPNAKTTSEATQTLRYFTVLCRLALSALAGYRTCIDVIDEPWKCALVKPDPTFNLIGKTG